MKIDLDLVRQAKLLGGFRSQAQAVNAALAEYIQRRAQLKIFELAGSIDYHRTYNYKRQRRIR